MDFYSVTLGLAVLAAVAALALTLVGRLATGSINTSGRRARGVRRLAGRVGVVALVLVPISGLSHVITGHPPGTSSALGPTAFLAEHPALLITTGVAVAALILLRLSRQVGLQDDLVRLRWREHDIELRNEPTYSPGSADNLRPYGREVALSGAHDHVSSRHGITVRHCGREIASCVVLATGGATTVHGRSAVVHGDVLYLAVGNQVCALELPSLTLHWHLEADVATCFGVVAVPGHDSLISHGELEIVRLALDGTVLWRQGGRDIFTGKLTLDTTGVEVADWNGDRYWFDLATGEPGSA